MASSCFSPAPLALGLVQLGLGLLHPLLGGFQTLSRAGGSASGLRLFRPLPAAFGFSPPFAFLPRPFRLLAVSPSRPAFRLPPSVPRSSECPWPVRRSCRRLSLLAGQSLGIVAAGGAALNVLLLLDDAVEPFQVLADPGLFVLDVLRAVLAHQQFQQRPKVLVDFRLVLQRPGELVLAQQFHEPLEADGDQLLLALRHGLLQQGGPARIGRRAQFRHAQQHVFEMLVLVGDALLFRGRACRRGRARTAFGGRIGGRRRGGAIRLGDSARQAMPTRSQAAMTANRKRRQDVAGSLPCAYSLSNSRIFCLCRCWVCSWSCSCVLMISAASPRPR